MKRPFALVGITYLLSLTAAVCFGAETALVLACLALFLFLLTLFSKRMTAGGALTGSSAGVWLLYGTGAASGGGAGGPGGEGRGHDRNHLRIAG